MTPEQEEHLQGIKDYWCDFIDKKYRAGQAEHGGDLWKKPGVMNMLLEEIADLMVYAPTVKYQQAHPEVIDPNLKDN